MGNELQEKSEMARRRSFLDDHSADDCWGNGVGDDQGMEQDGGRQEAVTRALTLIEAAEDLRVSRRWLEYWLADHPVDACVANRKRNQSWSISMTFTREQNLLLAQTHDEPRLPVRHWNAQRD